jgi:hypothetical protein
MRVYYRGADALVTDDPVLRRTPQSPVLVASAPPDR